MADYNDLIEGIKNKLSFNGDEVKFPIRDLVKAELLCYDDLNFAPRFLDMWPGLKGTDLWTFDVNESTIDEMIGYVVESHWNALPPERV